MLDEHVENICHGSEVFGRHLEVTCLKCLQDELVEDMEILVPVLGNIADKFGELGKVEYGYVKLVMLEAIEDFKDHSLSDNIIILEQAQTSENVIWTLRVEGFQESLRSLLLELIYIDFSELIVIFLLSLLALNIEE